MFHVISLSLPCKHVNFFYIDAIFPGTPLNKYSVDKIVEAACLEAEVYSKCNVVSHFTIAHCLYLPHLGIHCICMQLTSIQSIM